MSKYMHGDGVIGSWGVGPAKRREKDQAKAKTDKGENVRMPEWARKNAAEKLMISGSGKASCHAAVWFPHLDTTTTTATSRRYRTQNPK